MALASPHPARRKESISMAGLRDIGNLIARKPEIRGGRPILAGTGVTVHSIALWHKQGLTPEKIADQFGHLSLAQVYAALAYYHANREEIEADLAEEDRLSEDLAGEHETSRLEELKLEALAFSAEDRKVLADMLLESLHEELEIEKLWAKEARRRLQELIDGKVQAIPGPEAIRRGRAALRR
jgi:uncharacterized protein (DUF433 family)